MRKTNNLSNLFDKLLRKSVQDKTFHKFEYETLYNVFIKIVTEKKNELFQRKYM